MTDWYLKCWVPSSTWLLCYVILLDRRWYLYVVDWEPWRGGGNRVQTNRSASACWGSNFRGWRGRGVQTVSTAVKWCLHLLLKNFFSDEAVRVLVCHVDVAISLLKAWGGMICYYLLEITFFCLFVTHSSVIKEASLLYTGSPKLPAIYQVHIVCNGVAPPWLGSRIYYEVFLDEYHH